MSDILFIDSGEQQVGVPQCSCACHNQEIANVEAEVDMDGDPMPYLGTERRFWAEHPRFVDRRDPVAAVMACASCSKLHALAVSSHPEKVYEAEHGAPPPEPKPKLGGPQGRCEKDCRYCNGKDSVWQESK